MRIGADPESGRILFQSQNLKEAVIEGIEAGASLDLSGIYEGLSFYAALFVARSDYRDNGQPLNLGGHGVTPFLLSAAENDAGRATFRRQDCDRFANSLRAAGRNDDPAIKS